MSRCLIRAHLPVAALSQERGKVLKPFPIDFVKAVEFSAIDIDDGRQLTRPIEDGHDDLALAVSIAGDMSRELIHVLHKLRHLRLCRSTTDSTAKGYRLARNFTLEGS